MSADGHQALCAHPCSDACTRVRLHAHVHSKYLKVWLGQCPFRGCDLEKLRAPEIMGACSGIPQEQPHKFPCALKKNVKAGPWLQDQAVLSLCLDVPCRLSKVASTCQMG